MNESNLSFANGTLGVGDHYDIVDHYKTIARNLWLIAGFIILAVGVFGNCVSFIVLQTSYYRPHPTGLLLSILAVCDTLSLVTGLVRKWILELTENGYDVRSDSVVGCKLHAFLTYYSQTLGSWTIVVFTLDRTISVLLPLKSKQYFTYRRVLATWLLGAVVLASFYSQVFFIFSMATHVVAQDNGENDTYHVCNFLPYYFDINYNKVFYWVDLSLFSTLPFVAIASCNGVIIASLVKMRRAQQVIRATPGGGDKNKRRGTIILLMVVSLVFVLTTLPYALHFATYSYIPRSTAYAKAVDAIISVLVYLLYFSNNAINFLLYCVCAERFRIALKTSVCRAAVTPPSSMSQVSRVSRKRSGSNTCYTYVDLRHQSCRRPGTAQDICRNNSVLRTTVT